MFVCVIMDERRPDLREHWYAAMRCIRIHDLQIRCRMVTWQEVARVVPGALRKFLGEKYGISGKSRYLATLGMINRWKALFAD
jgi:restriction endonuclease-like protein